MTTDVNHTEKKKRTLTCVCVCVCVCVCLWGGGGGGGFVFLCGGRFLSRSYVADLMQHKLNLDVVNF